MAAIATPELTRLTPEEELHWLALRMVPGLGPRRGHELLEKFRSPVMLFRAGVSELEGFGLSGSLARTIASGCVFEDAVRQQERLKATGTSLVTFVDPRYPARLREIFDPPLMLFTRGSVELLSRVAVAIVGTRAPSAYGTLAAARFSTDLAKAGLVIVSGMARGIDSSAHKACLEADGDTVAIFGSGVDVIYPAENRRLSEEIAGKGLLASEFPMGSPSYPQNFPIRNRIVSGISAGVVVVEGAQYSGSAITARLAMDQGREVFAVPGNITSRQSWGPNLLIRQGATLVQDWQDVVEQLNPEDRRALSARRSAELTLTNETSDDSTPDPLTDPRGRLRQDILRNLAFDKPTHLDHLIEVLDTHSSTELIAGLFDLELDGIVRQLPGKQYIKVW
jgi:DNA processing protein